jgi:hypothetical protein
VKVFYLDSSPWVKRYYQERGSDRVQELFAADDGLACSALGVVEVVATLARQCKGGEIASADLNVRIA